MLKALFLDMDETLCDTAKANTQAKLLFGQSVQKTFGAHLDGAAIASAYVSGIYRSWSDAQKRRYQPIADRSEAEFRVQLIQDLLASDGIDDVTQAQAQALQDQFDRDRIAAFDFYPGITDFLAEARKSLTLVVITNGPEFSQIPKVQRVDLAAHVDHVIIGGQEPEEKPSRSIFEKAMALANCEAHEAMHVGDSLHTDIVGAHNSGITSVWVQHQQPLDAELGINPHHTVMHPTEIPELIKNLS